MDKGGEGKGKEREENEEKIAAYIAFTDADVRDANYYIVGVFDGWEGDIFETSVSRPI